MDEKSAAPVHLFRVKGPVKGARPPSRQKHGRMVKAAACLRRVFFGTETMIKATAVCIDRACWYPPERAFLAAGLPGQGTPGAGPSR